MEKPDASDIESRRDFLFQSIRRLANFAAPSEAPASHPSAKSKSEPPAVSPGTVDASASGPAAGEEESPAPAAPPSPLWINRRDSMAYAPLGRTGLMASRFVLGSRDLALLGPEGLAEAVGMGVNLLVATPETLAANPWLGAELPQYRDRLWLALALPAEPLLGSLPSLAGPAPPLFNPALFWDELEFARTALGGGRIDLLLFSGSLPDAGLGDDALREALYQAQRENRIGFAGLALDPADEDRISAALETDWVDVLALPFNALNFTRLAPLLQEAAERGIGVLSARTTRGIVERAGDSPLGLMELPEDTNAAEMAYLYMLKNGPQAGFLCNFGTRENLRRTLALGAVKLDVFRANELDAVVEDEIWPDDDLREILSP